jgi:hypothetical protein
MKGRKEERKEERKVIKKDIPSASRKGEKI